MTGSVAGPAIGRSRSTMPPANDGNGASSAIRGVVSHRLQSAESGPSSHPQLLAAGRELVGVTSTAMGPLTAKLAVTFDLNDRSDWTGQR